MLQFYEANRNGNNAMREAPQLIEAVEDKKVILVVGKNTSNIEAVAATFRYRDGQYVEMGATFVTPQLRGFKIQLITIWNRTLAEEICDPDFARFFTVVRESNYASVKNLKSSGFVSKCPDAVIARLKKLDGRVYFELPRSCRYDHARNLLAAADSPHTT